MMCMYFFKRFFRTQQINQSNKISFKKERAGQEGVLIVSSMYLLNEISQAIFGLCNIFR